MFNQTLRLFMKGYENRFLTAFTINNIQYVTVCYILRRYILAAIFPTLDTGPKSSYNPESIGYDSSYGNTFQASDSNNTVYRISVSGSQKIRVSVYDIYAGIR